MVYDLSLFLKLIAFKCLRQSGMAFNFHRLVDEPLLCSVKHGLSLNRQFVGALISVSILIKLSIEVGHPVALVLYISFNAPLYINCSGDSKPISLSITAFQTL